MKDFFLIVDKPLTRIVPELHEDNKDNEDHIINNKIIPSNNFHILKSNIVNDKFVIQIRLYDQ